MKRHMGRVGGGALLLLLSVFCLAYGLRAANRVEPSLWTWSLLGDEDHPRAAAVGYVVIEKESGDTLEAGRLLAVELNLTEGGTRWEDNILFIDKGTSGTFTLDQSNPHVKPQGFLWLELRGDTLAQSVASGVYERVAPRVGARLPLRLPLRTDVALDYPLRRGMDRNDIVTRFFTENTQAAPAARRAARQELTVEPEEDGRGYILSWSPSSTTIRYHEVDLIYDNVPRPLEYDTVFTRILPQSYYVPGSDWPWQRYR